jgi:hypothetical protein
MRVLTDMKKRMEAGSVAFARPGYFENKLRRAAHFTGSIVWVVSSIALASYIMIRCWSVMPAYLVFMFICGVVGVISSWVDIILDHRRMHAAIRANSPDEVAKQALRLAAGQAAGSIYTIFFVTVILFVFGVLVRGGRLLVH